MALDIAALQAMYGARLATNARNTTYTLTDPGKVPLDIDGNDGTVSIGRAFYCIYDRGGLGDTIRYDGSMRSIINLNDATLSTDKIREDKSAIADLQDFMGLLMGHYLPDELIKDITDPQFHFGGYFSRLVEGGEFVGEPVLGGYSIAHGTVIERAVGGSGVDVIIGNESNNRILGNRGGDTIVGGFGNDTIHGGSGEDSEGGSGRDSIDGGVGNDSLAGGDDFDRLEGGIGNDFLRGGTDRPLAQGAILSDSDQLFGEAGNDTIHGGLDRDSVFGGIGDDVLYGGPIDPAVLSFADSDQLIGGVGNDRLYDDEGEDRLFGGDDNDELSGGREDDYLDGGRGRDILDGGSGADTLNGGPGVDVLNGGLDTGSAWFQNADTYIVDSPRDVVIEMGHRNLSGDDTLILSFGGRGLSYAGIDNYVYDGKQAFKGSFLAAGLDRDIEVISIDVGDAGSSFSVIDTSRSIDSEFGGRLIFGAGADRFQPFSPSMSRGLSDPSNPVRSDDPYASISVEDFNYKEDRIDLSGYAAVRGKLEKSVGTIYDITDARNSDGKPGIDDLNIVVGFGKVYTIRTGPDPGDFQRVNVFDQYLNISVDFLGRGPLSVSQFIDQCLIV